MYKVLKANGNTQYEHFEKNFAKNKIENEQNIIEYWYPLKLYNAYEMAFNH